MPSTEELGKEEYAEKREIAIKAITEEMIAMTEQVRDSDLSARELADLISEINDYASESREEEKKNAYDDGFVRGIQRDVGSAEKTVISKTPSEEEHYKSLSQIMSERKDEFLTFCTIDGSEKITENTAAKYVSAVIKFCKNVSKPVHLSKYQYVAGNEGLYPSGKVRRGVSKLLKMIETNDETDIINGEDITKWYRHLSKLVDSDRAREKKILEKNIKTPHDITLTEMQEWYQELPDRYRFYFYCLAVSGARINPFHKFMRLPQKERMEHVTVIKHDDPAVIEKYDGAVVGDLLRIDITEFSAGTKDELFIFLPIECYQSLLNFDNMRLNTDPSTIWNRTKPHQLNARRKERDGADYSGDITIKQCRKFFLNYCLLKYVPSVLTEKQINHLQSRDTRDTASENYYDMRKQVTISYSRIVDDLKTILPLPSTETEE